MPQKPILESPEEDDSSESIDRETLTDGISTHRSSDERDEVEEVEKTLKKDTKLLRLWRFIVTFVLLMTALAVTLTTYKVLKDEQQKNFQVAVRTNCVRM